MEKNQAKKDRLTLPAVVAVWAVALCSIAAASGFTLSDVSDQMKAEEAKAGAYGALGEALNKK